MRKFNSYALTISAALFIFTLLSFASLTIPVQADDCFADAESTCSNACGENQTCFYNCYNCLGCLCLYIYDACEQFYHVCPY